MPNNPPRLGVTAVLAALAACAWLVPLAILVVVPAGLKRRYDEFGLKLPSLTQAVIAANGFLLDYWWLTLPVLVGGTILVAGVGSYLVRHHVRSRVVSVLWWLLAFGPPVIITVVVVAASVLPEVKLREGLNK